MASQESNALTQEEEKKYNQVKKSAVNPDSLPIKCKFSIQPTALLTEELEEYGRIEKKNIYKEETQNRNHPHAFLKGGTFGEYLTLLIYPDTIGGASKGGIAYDNMTIGKDNKLISAKEVKYVNLVGAKKCNKCERKCPPFQKKCIFCNGEDFKDISDSRAGISSDAHIKYKDYIIEYIVYVENYNKITNTISLKGYKFISKNAYFDTYIQNQYDNGNKKGGTCNFIPYSYDWFMSGPISIINIDINISNAEPEIIYHLYNPLSEIYDDIPYDKFEKLLNSDEKKLILDKTILINGCFKYDYIKDIFKLRAKNIGKSRGSTSRK